MDKIRAFFLKSGHFLFDFQKRVGEPPPPLVAPLLSPIPYYHRRHTIKHNIAQMTYTSKVYIPCLLATIIKSKSLSATQKTHGIKGKAK